MTTYREQGLRDDLVNEAAGLLEPTEPLIGGEYRRGMVELIVRVLGLSHNEHQGDIEAEIGRRLQLADDTMPCGCAAGMCYCGDRTGLT